MTVPDSSRTAGKGRSRRAPRKATPERLEKAAWAYLERYASSTENLRRVLLRRVQRSAAWHGTDPEAGTAAVDDIVTKLQRFGVLDDTAYAEGRARTLHRAGHGSRTIRARLAQKGVPEPAIAAALDRLHAEAADPDLGAALRYARKRGIGPYRRANRAANRDRDLAALCRRGFSVDLAEKVVDTREPDELAAEAACQPGPLG